MTIRTLPSNALNKCAVAIVPCLGMMALPIGAPMATPELSAQFDAHRSYLLRVARLPLRTDQLAEDVVQDTLLAARQGAAGSSGKSSVKTWLTGILKHKIVDAIRRKTSAPELTQLHCEQ